MTTKHNPGKGIRAAAIDLTNTITGTVGGVNVLNSTVRTIDVLAGTFKRDRADKIIRTEYGIGTSLITIALVRALAFKELQGLGYEFKPWTHPWLRNIK
ncbi:hypothetical protein HY612_01930 [Candidatus Roizmanbacteria bacterium]|nr:hypothetical protein [Candidatus Roizmanbacteria bacterium]